MLFDIDGDAIIVSVVIGGNGGGGLVIFRHILVFNIYLEL